MEGKKYILIFIFTFYIFTIQGQNNQSIYNAFASGNMHKWKFSMDSIDNKKQKSNKEVLELINYQYGYIAWCIGKKYSIEAERYIKKATENIDYLYNRKFNLSMLYSYKAAFVGFEIGLAPYKAPFIGQKSLDYAQKSISIDSTNAFGYNQLGNISFYTPKVVGGNKPLAIKHYLNALRIMEQKNEYLINNWNYLNLLATIVNAYIETKQYDNAKKYCNKIMIFEPDFDWMKNKICPQIINKK